WALLLVLFLVHESDYAGAYDRGVRLVDAGQFGDAATQFERILQRNPGDSYLRFRTAILCLAAGDQERYRRHCRDLLDRARTSGNPATADQAAKATLLGGPTGADLSRAVELAERAARLGAKDPWAHWFFLVRGIAAYRTGKDDDALVALRECQKAHYRPSEC